MFKQISLAALLLLVFFTITTAQPVVINPNMWVTNGEVNAVVRSGNTIYLGGSFSYVGRQTGSWVPLDETTGQPLGSFPQVNGRVRAMLSDGAGGWYIGGGFTFVAGVARKNIAHILPNNTVDLNWNPDAENDVYCFALSGSTVYVGGRFSNIGGQSRNQIAALDATTGLATSWNPVATGSNPTVFSIEINGSTVFAAGAFSGMGGQNRNNIAALDATTGLATSWNPNVNNLVHTLAINGNTIYIGGLFTSIGGQPRNRVGQIDLSTALPTSWDPNASGPLDPRVYSLAVSGNTVYVGGQFTNIGGQNRNHIAAIDATTGLATAWNPDANFQLFSLIISGSTVYVGGEFTSVGGQNRDQIAAIDASSGQVTSWNPSASGSVSTLAANGSTIYAGGLTICYGGQKRNRIAALDATTGMLTNWNPDADNTVLTLAVNGSTIYAGGEFEQIGGQSRNYIAALNATTGLATNWNPEADDIVNALAVKGSTVYAGGEFEEIGGESRNYIAALNATTGLATNWYPETDDIVHAIVVVDSTVYLGGEFNTVHGITRNRIAAINANTGLVTNWNPNADREVYAIDVVDSTVYLGGRFRSIGGITRNRIAAINANTGLVTNWNPDASSNVNSLKVSNNTVYAGGNFSSIGGQTRRFLAALDLTTGLAKSWDPAPNSTVNSIIVNNSKVYTGGFFKDLNGYSRGGFAEFSDISCPVTPTITPSGPTTFTQGGSVTLTAPAGFSYLWSTNETTQSINVTTSGNYTVQTIANGCTSEVSEPIVVTVNTLPSVPTFTGTGVWTSTSNWSINAVPTSADSVVIATGAIIDLEDSKTVISILIQPGATLNLKNNSFLNIGNYLNNQGTVAVSHTGNSNVTTEGRNGESRITGNPIAFNTLNVIGNLKTDVDLTIYQELRLSSGTFNANGKVITLKSTVNGTARLRPETGTLANANNFVVEKYNNPSLATATGAWLLVGAQTSGQNVNLWSANNSYTASTFTTPNVANGASLYEFDPTFALTGANGYKKLTSATASAPIGKGFRVWFKTNPFFNGGATWKTTGTPITGDHTWTLKYCSGANCAAGGNANENGWNLIANPYAAPIDWTAATGWTKTNIYNATYIYNSKAANNASYVNGVGVNGGTNIIPSAQAFIIWANNANATLSATNQVIEGNQPSENRAGATDNVLKINIAGTNSLTDQVAIRWDAAATAGFDNNLEARKLFSPAGINLAFLSGTSPMAIMAEPLPIATTTYPLEVTSQSNGIYTFSFEALESLTNPQWLISLVDNETGIITPVTATSSYSFSTSANTGRFSLVVNPTSVTSLASAAKNKVWFAPNPVANTTTLQLASAVSQPTTFRIINALGQVVLTANLPANATSLNLDLSSLTKGVYMVYGMGVTKLVKE